MLNRVLCIAMVMAMCLALVPSAMAADASAGKSNVAVIDVNLILNDDAAVPTTQFTMTITNGSVATPKFPLFNGVMTGLKVGKTAASTAAYANSYNVVFDGNETTKPGLPSDATTAGKKYATETLAISFADVTFPEPGVYRYVVTETAPAAPFSLRTGETNTRYIDVYVEHEKQASGSYAAALTIQGIVTYSAAPAVTTGTLGGTDQTTTPNKSESIDNELTTYNLTLNKTVTGNQANRNEYFEFVVTVTNPTAAAGSGIVFATSYVVDLTRAPGNATHVNSSSITAGTATSFYLKHGESLAIQGLPAGATYTIVEKASGYVASGTITVNGTLDTTLQNGTANTDYSVANNKSLTGDTTVAIGNDRTGIIPTGVLLTIAPFAALMVIGLVGVVVFLKKKRND